MFKLRQPDGFLFWHVPYGTFLSELKMSYVQRGISHQRLQQVQGWKSKWPFCYQVKLFKLTVHSSTDLCIHKFPISCKTVTFFDDLKILMSTELWFWVSQDRCSLVLEGWGFGNLNIPIIFCNRSQHCYSGGIWGMWSVGLDFAWIIGLMPFAVIFVP